MTSGAFDNMAIDKSSAVSRGSCPPIGVDVPVTVIATRRCTGWSSGGIPAEYPSEVYLDSTPLSCCFVRPLGFEPRTCGLRVRCSAVELEARKLVDISRWGG